jgi:hypothetical protein
MVVTVVVVFVVGIIRGHFTDVLYVSFQSRRRALTLTLRESRERAAPRRAVPAT